ncbi:hypothetical protein CTAYLR_009479 [Chrysophaeum taylorii]|uniref:1-deoxy-D-xylulose 5-phosphate reductoisomerase, apicoplastic n=1 Tax=Chrysophaeum taylorii TaxID=2483200 RepID=A0AAD7XRU7_9STRA|nr:hypothetical protein CTAYLR_009479 [Chrysophaeum taylorii]
MRGAVLKKWVGAVRDRAGARNPRLTYVPTALYAANASSRLSPGQQRQKARRDAKQRRDEVCAALGRTCEAATLDLFDGSIEHGSWPRDASDAILSADCVFLDGGNTFWLRACLDAYWDLMRSTSAVYVGVSAGAIVAGTSVSTALWKGWDDETVAPPRDWAQEPGMGLVPYAIFPHYDDDDWGALVERRKVGLAEDLLLLDEHGGLVVDDDRGCYYHYPQTRRRHVRMSVDITNRGYVRVESEAPTVSYPRAAPVLDVESLRKPSEVEDTWERRIAVLGSTGSIGTQTLDFARARPDRFRVVALCAGSNFELLARQAIEFRDAVQIVGLSDASKAADLKEALGDLEVEVVVGPDAATACATARDADVVVTGVVGCAGLAPTVAAISAGKDIALANKETLIAGGPAILPLLKKHGVAMTPADSEHSAIFQCLQGVPAGALRKIILTASGGAFRDLSAEDLAAADPAWVRTKATTHPNWDMGAKITVDSATMMNKGLEVIEAHYLFGAAYDDIDVVVHPQSIIHSAVELQDNSVIAQCGWPDMRLPLLYSVSWPHRLRMPADQWERRFNFVELGSMTFKAPDNGKYPCIGLAYAAGRVGGTMTACLNAANEMANQMFRENTGLDYFDIPRVIEKAMDDHKADFLQAPTLDDIIHVDAWARDRVRREADDNLRAPRHHFVAK